jgi:translation initiation factor 2 beta subunit (eIF-2beta)/eIF-5
MVVGYPIYAINCTLKDLLTLVKVDESLHVILQGQVRNSDIDVRINAFRNLFVVEIDLHKE